MADIYCNVCNTNLGWKYEMAYEQSQKYKEGARAHLLGKTYAPGIVREFRLKVVLDYE